MIKIALYGGKIELIQNAIYKLNLLEVQIQYIIENSHKTAYEGTVHFGIPYYDSNHIRNDTDYILVIAWRQYTNIREELVRKGVPEEKIKPFVDRSIQNYSSYFPNGIYDYSDKEIELLYMKPWSVKKQIGILNSKWSYYQTIETMARESNAWYMKANVIAHAGGGLVNMDGDSHLMTNSEEAFMTAVKMGNKLIEIDVNYIYNNDLFASHDNFLLMHNQKFGFTPLSFRHVVHTLSKYKNVSVLIDIWWEQHEDYIKIVDFMEYILHEEIQENVFNEVKKRILLEVYDIETIEYAEKLGYGMFLTQYRKEYETDFIGCINECIGHHIPAVGFQFEIVKQHADQMKIFKRKGIKVYCHTVDRLEDIIWLSRIGVEGYFSNYIIDRGERLWQN